MARAHFVTYIHDTEGRPIPGASVEVREPGTSTEISQTLYDADTPDMTTLTNPFTADADGKLEAFVDTPQVVDFFITKPGYDSVTLRGTFQQLTASTLTLEDGGSPMAQRPNIDFQDGFVLTDNAGATQTEIDLDYATTTELANVTKAAEAAGTSPKVARGDHKHDITTAAAGASAPGASAAEGTATSLARSDHAHSREAYATTVQLANVDNAAESAGTDASVARGDHKHGVSSAAAGASAPGDSAAAGTATTLSLSDHRHSREAYATVTELVDVSHAAEAAGTSGTVARGDHKHAASVAGTAEIANVALAEAAGASNTIPRGDHVHAHGSGYVGGHTDVVLHSATDHLDRVRTEWIPVDAWGAQVGAALTNFGSVPDIVRTREFAASGSDDSAGFTFLVPQDWGGGAINIVLMWAPSNTDLGNCVWRASVVELGIGDNIATKADATLTTVTDAGAGVTNGLQQTTFSTNMPTPSAAGVVMKATIQRQGTVAGDTLTGTARVLGAYISYTADS